MNTFRTHYDNLQVSRTASDAVIRAAYKSLSQKYHPDKNPKDTRAEHIMKTINEAYDVLSNPERRRLHDEWIRTMEQTADKRADPTVQGEPNSPEQCLTNPPHDAKTRLGFARRVWLMFLFVVSGLMLFGVLPYQIVIENFKWSYAPAILLWLWVGHYSYTSLFPKQNV